MRITRIKHRDGCLRHGIVEDGTILLSPPGWDWMTGAPPPGGERVPLAGAHLVAPLDPVNILAIGRNYRDHSKELGGELPAAPLMFMKATSAVIAHGDDIVLPAAAPDAVDFEAELAVVIGRTAHRVPESAALDHVLGYTCANDVSARDCQRADGQWCRSKSFDTFCPLGPWIETELDPTRCTIKGRVGDVTQQDAHTGMMIFAVPFLVSYLSQGMTLVPGTVILTGTPGGVGVARKPPRFLRPGDVIEVEIGGIGTLRNRVVAASREPPGTPC